jgi:hypothetical protein
MGSPLQFPPETGPAASASSRRIPVQKNLLAVISPTFHAFTLSRFQHFLILSPSSLRVME